MIYHCKNCMVLTKFQGRFAPTLIYWTGICFLWYFSLLVAVNYFNPFKESISNTSEFYSRFAKIVLFMVLFWGLPQRPTTNMALHRFNELRAKLSELREKKMAKMFRKLVRIPKEIWQTWMWRRGNKTGVYPPVGKGRTRIRLAAPLFLMQIGYNNNRSNHHRNLHYKKHAPTPKRLSTFHGPGYSFPFSSPDSAEL